MNDRWVNLHDGGYVYMKSQDDGTVHLELVASLGRQASLQLLVHEAQQVERALAETSNEAAENIA